MIQASVLRVQTHPEHDAIHNILRVFFLLLEQLEHDAIHQNIPLIFLYIFLMYFWSGHSEGDPIYKLFQKKNSFAETNRKNTV